MSERKGKKERKVKDKIMIFFSLLRSEQERTVMASGEGDHNNLSKSSLKSHGLRKRLTMNSDMKAQHEDSDAKPKLSVTINAVYGD